MGHILALPKGKRKEIRTKLMLGIKEFFVHTNTDYDPCEWVDLGELGINSTWDSERKGYKLRRK